jgi:Arc/MetJ-type ribon-helix-helix transcriptional regulator
MQITLPPELEQIVQTYINSGKYQTATEVLLAGVKRLQQEDALTDITFGILNEEIQFIALTESEMIRESLKVLETPRNSIPLSQVEMWVNSLANEPQTTDE